MPIRLVAVDLDGTLLNSRAEVSPANRQALQATRERGLEVALVTGRRAQSAGKFLAQIPCAVTLISSNGALITSASGEVLHRNFLPCDAARRVLEVAQPWRPYAVAIHNRPGRGQVVMQDNAASDGPLAWYQEKSPGALEQVPDLVAAPQDDLIQVMFGGPPLRIEPVESVLRSSAVAEAIHLTWTKYPTRHLALLDVMARGCTKGAALALLARRLGVARDEVMAVGDNFNDLEMLQFAGLPVVMGNHSPGFPDDSWPVTLPNDEDGVAAALRRYVLS